MQAKRRGEAHALAGMVSSGDPEQTALEPPRLLERSIALVRATCSCGWTGVCGQELCGLFRGPHSGPLCSVPASRASLVEHRVRGLCSDVQERVKNRQFKSCLSSRHCWSHSARVVSHCARCDLHSASALHSTHQLAPHATPPALYAKSHTVRAARSRPQHARSTPGSI